MKATLMINGEKIWVEITEKELEKLKLKKRTGYERVNKSDWYYSNNFDGTLDIRECYGSVDDRLYDVANYYNDEQLTQNCGRADNLKRQLRRFSAEHRKKKIDWKDDGQCKYSIGYGYNHDKLYVSWTCSERTPGGIYFDSKRAAELAIEEFRDELIWYFTEFEDSL